MRSPERFWAGDTGLARERSDLSWGRTLLSVVTVTALFLRWIPIHGGRVLVPIVLGVGAGAAGATSAVPTRAAGPAERTRTIRSQPRTTGEGRMPPCRADQPSSSPVVIGPACQRRSGGAP